MDPDRFNVGYVDLESMPDGIEKAIQYAVSGLLTDGGHHKQWCLEKILEALGEDLRAVRGALQSRDYDWEDGIPP